MRDHGLVSITHFLPGNYRALTVHGHPFSDGVVADPGFDLVRAVFAHPQPLEMGFEAARSLVEAAGRPIAALAGFELRIPEPLSAEGFSAFNGPYVKEMVALGLTTPEGLVTTTRTNVAPTVAGITQPSLLSFTYTVPRQGASGTAFRLSGATETREGSAGERLGSIVDLLEKRLGELRVSWDNATGVTVYGASFELDAALLARFGAAALLGVRWCPSLPPVTGADFEIDAHGVRTEQIA